MNIMSSIFVRNVVSKLGLLQRFNPVSNYHSLVCKSLVKRNESFIGDIKMPAFLTPLPVFNVPSCGFKFKGIVKKRCKDCYIVVKDRQKIVLCRSHPRHKQKEIVPREKDTWIITHRTHGVIRPW